ncbi:MAG: type II secretion system protein GspK [Spirochaetota bacterium]|nr:type II secretion system protein GspK [Spirochaetota bacterium]
MFDRLKMVLRKNYIRRREILHGRGVFKYLTNSSGYVLIIVLLITSLLVSISSEFLIVAQTNMNYIRKFSERLKAHTLAKAGVNLSTFILMADKRGLASQFLGIGTTDKNIDCYNDIWAMDFPVIPLEDGYLEIDISDENSKINLSVLANEVVDRTPYYSITQRFFLNMGFPIDMADVIIDWVDIDDSRFPYGAESSDYYHTLVSSYDSKNSEMDSIDELLLVKGITPEIFYGIGGGTFGWEENLVDDNKGGKRIDQKLLEGIAEGDILEAIKEDESDFSDLTVEIGKESSRRLSDYLRVKGERADYLSELNKININTAPFRVLSALTDNMTDDVVTELISMRHANPFKSVEDIKDFIEDENVRKNILTVKSYIFKIVSTGTVNRTSVKITAHYYRDGKRFLYWSEE